MTRDASVRQLDRWALATGVCGFVSLVAGVALINGPAALIVAGLGLMAWSYLMARAVSIANRAADQVPT